MIPLKGVRKIYKAQEGNPLKNKVKNESFTYFLFRSAYPLPGSGKQYSLVLVLSAFTHLGALGVTLVTLVVYATFTLQPSSSYKNAVRTKKRRNNSGRNRGEQTATRK